MLWIDAVTFVVSAGIVAVAVPGRVKAPERPSAEEVTAPSGYLEEIRTGLRFIGRERLLFWLVVSVCLGQLTF